MKLLRMTIQMKATDQYFHVVRFIYAGQLCIKEYKINRGNNRKQQRLTGILN